jgi:hypothetical protein
MTRVLRISMYGGLHEPPVTMVVNEGSMTVPLEEAAGVVSQPPDMLVITQIFESDGDDVPQWTADAMIQAEKHIEDERNMSILYWWMVGHFPIMVDGGIIGTQRATPLATDEIVYVFRALAERTDYRSFGFFTHTEGGDTVEFRSGNTIVNGQVQAAS